MNTLQAMMKVNMTIPGILPSPPKSKVDGKITDLSSKTILELLELRDRQRKLLNNKSFIAKLADKGGKIQAFHDKIVVELKTKHDEEQTCKLFGHMKLGDTYKDSVHNMEWEGKIGNKGNVILDSDDDSDPDDVLHILSQSTTLEKKIKVLEPEKLLITTEELITIGEAPHVKYIVEKSEIQSKPKSTGQFKPFKTTISDVHKPEKEILRKKHKNWEVTAATPPPSLHGPAKVLNLEESLKLQKEHNIHLKEIEAQHAAEKLQARLGINVVKVPELTVILGKYREEESDDETVTSDPEGSDKEVHDEEPERGGVVFTVMK